MRHKNAQPQQHEVIRRVTKSIANLMPVTSGGETRRVGTASHYAGRPGIDSFEFTLRPVGEEHGHVHFAVLGTIIKVVQAVKDRTNRPNGLGLPGLLQQVGDIIAHPHHGAAALAFEPNGSPLRRPMMRVPDLMPLFYNAREMQHVKIASQKCRVAQFGPAAAPHFYHSDVPSDLRTTSGWVIG